MSSGVSMPYRPSISSVCLPNMYCAAWRMSSRVMSSFRCSFSPKTLAGLLSRLLPPMSSGTCCCLPSEYVVRGCSVMRRLSMQYFGRLRMCARRMSVSAGRARISLMSLQRHCFMMSMPSASASASVVHLLSDTTDPLETMACAKRSFDSGEATSMLTEKAPADSPAMVMRAGSPPNCRMFSFSQRMAASWS